MPIEMKPAAWIGTQVFPTIQEAQEKEIASLIFGDKPATEGEKEIIERFVEHTDEIVAILTCAPKPKSPRKPRKDIGTKRKAKQAGGGLIIRGEEVP